MKKPFLLFALKFGVIVYFVACTSIDNLKNSHAVTPIVTKGVWKVQLYTADSNDHTDDLQGYTFTFKVSGLLEVNNNGKQIRGNWFEDEFANTIGINLETADPSLSKLNTQWKFHEINNSTVELLDERKNNEE